MAISDYISLKQVSRVLGVSESSLYRLSQSPDFPCPYKIGGWTFYSEKEVRDLLESQKLGRLWA